MDQFNHYLDKYAELIVKTGVNVSDNHSVILEISVTQAPLARLITKKAYELGAKEVIVRWNDDEILKETVAHKEAVALETVADYQLAEVQDWVDKKASRISVVSANPDALSGVPSERVGLYQKFDRKLLFNLRQAGQSNKISWTVVAASGAEWAKKVFPELATEEEQVDALWDAIFKATKVYEDSPIEAWQKHEALLREKADMLNKEQFAKLHYTAPGTDLTVGLPKNHVWDSARSINATGEEFMANMPTEEVFTAPDCRVADGYVTSTKPLSYGGTTLIDMTFHFENGEIVKAEAKEGEEVLNHLINMDPGSKRLGEVALVPDPSPISQSGITFYNTLFDENASNHLAIGNGYAFNIKDGVDMSEEDLEKIGLNRSQNHVDFMIGSDKMDVDGIREDGSVVPVFRNGNWA
ncbi:MAG: aminopeptidase [Vagococcus sp.]|uniref:aminopeptidase n=1 Tax=Vagococcus sp. TaxID=1933889 RepID=UPI002FC853F1